MEYCIFKRYQEKIKEEITGTVWQKHHLGKKIAIVSLGIIYISCIILFLQPVRVLENNLTNGGKIAFSVAVLVFIAAVKTDNSFGMNQNFEKNKQKLKILCEVLQKDFEIHNREKIQELIDLYQMLLGSHVKEGDKIENLLKFLTSFCIGALTVLWASMKELDISVNDWLDFALVIVPPLAVLWGLLIFLTKFAPERQRYETMIKDLNELLLMKY